MIDIFSVNLTEKAKKDLEKVPHYIKNKFYFWLNSVIEEGLAKIRQIPGFHDEPLKGARKGQRSIRLNKAYRAIYVIHNKAIIIDVIEVNKHDY